MDWLVTDDSASVNVRLNTRTWSFPVEMRISCDRVPPINESPLRARLAHHIPDDIYVGLKSRVGLACRSTTHPRHLLPIWGSNSNVLARVAIRQGCGGVLVRLLALVTAVSLMAVLLM